MVHEGGRLAERLRAARQQSFVGRRRELTGFRDALAGGPGAYAVLYLHGAGGVGKSTLLRRFADEARDAGRTVVEIDGGAVDAAGFEIEVAEGLVLLVDSFERCQGLEGWMRETYLPKLPAGAVAVLAGQEPPDPLWASDVSWSELLRVATLGDLDPGEAAELLRLRGVPDVLHESVLAFAGGHPLALSLAASAASRELPVSRWTPSRDVLTTLIDQLVGEVPSPAHRHALEVSAHAESTTEELLRAVVGNRAAEIFDWLRRLPFIRSDRNGLHPHGVVRSALEADLRWRDPQGYERLHHNVATHMLDRARTASGEAVQPAMRALWHLLRANDVVAPYEINPVRTDGEVYATPLHPEDHPWVRRMGADSAILRFWLDRRPEAFTAYRRASDHTLIAFAAHLRLTEPDPEELAVDPAVAQAWAGAETAPPRPGEHVFITRYLYPPIDRRPAQAGILMQLQSLEAWIRSARLAWSFVVVPEPDRLLPLMAFTDHHPVAGGARMMIDGHPHGVFGHDWRALPVDAWITALNARLLFGPDARPGRPAFTVLSRADFDAAVRDALKNWHLPDALESNPLLGTHLIGDRGGNPAQTLRDLIVEAVDSLRDDAREGKLHRALATTYFHRAPTQEAAAEKLGVPFSTYRRHLTRGVERVAERLWQLEV
ncbi:ATP-binding protein [Catenuloplanes japonicus]|uniref:ATP-binding protein n=1 Tax=Catenuloplanes japonicus TaxID=33876 RepID=UPI000525DFCC|nr:ATP-binding protein [Catenuloplanes japonicus]